MEALGACCLGGRRWGLGHIPSPTWCYHGVLGTYFEHTLVELLGQYPGVPDDTILLLWCCLSRLGNTLVYLVYFAQTWYMILKFRRGATLVHRVPGTTFGVPATVVHSLIYLVHYQCTHWKTNTYSGCAPGTPTIPWYSVNELLHYALVVIFLGGGWCLWVASVLVPHQQKQNRLQPIMWV